MEKLKIETIPTKPIDENCTVIKNEDTKEAIVIDPGSDVQTILETIGDFKVIAILATHGHYDHIGQVATLKERYNAPFYMHKEDEFLLNDELFPGFSSI
jgi:Zn-dependent hydrolases, including glyoxylases